MGSPEVSRDFDIKFHKNFYIEGLGYWRNSYTICKNIDNLTLDELEDSNYSDSIESGNSREDLKNIDIDKSSELNSS